VREARKGNHRAALLHSRYGVVRDDFERGVPPQCANDVLGDAVGQRLVEPTRGVIGERS
jgi:hypothetical protein